MSKLPGKPPAKLNINIQINAFLIIKSLLGNVFLKLYVNVHVYNKWAFIRWALKVKAWLF